MEAVAAASRGVSHAARRTEAEPPDAWTQQQRRTSHRACVVERRIHSNPAKRQHMFTVKHRVLSSVVPLCRASCCPCVDPLLGQSCLSSSVGCSYTPCGHCSSTHPYTITTCNHQALHLC